MVTQFSSAVSELHTDDAESCASEIVSPANKPRICRCHQYHTTTMCVNNAGTRFSCIGWCVHIQGNVVTIHAFDRFDCIDDIVIVWHDVFHYRMPYGGSILKCFCIFDRRLYRSAGRIWRLR